MEEAKKKAAGHEGIGTPCGLVSNYSTNTFVV